MATSTTKRPWLAVVLAVLVTGAGHVYLRRWLRALGWFVLVEVAIAVFVSDLPTIGELAALRTASPAEIAATMPPLSETLPVFAIVLLSWIDAYRLAAATTGESDASDSPNETASEAGTATTEPDRPDQCPSCGREVDDDLDFCQWCSEPLTTDADAATESR